MFLPLEEVVMVEFWEVIPSEPQAQATRILWWALASLGLNPGGKAASTCIPKLCTEEASSSGDSTATKFLWPHEDNNLHCSMAVHNSLGVCKSRNTSITPVWSPATWEDHYDLPLEGLGWPFTGEATDSAHSCWTKSGWPATTTKTRSGESTIHASKFWVASQVSPLVISPPFSEWTLTSLCKQTTLYFPPWPEVANPFQSVWASCKNKSPHPCENSTRIFHVFSIHQCRIEHPFNSPQVASDCFSFTSF